MKKKQLLFVNYGLGIGGIEKCLVNLINALPEETFDVDLLLMSPQYTMQPQIRRKVHIYNEFDYILYSGGAMDAIRSRGGIGKNLGKVLRLIPFRYLDQHGGNGWKLYRKLPREYDIAIAYSQNGYGPYYVIDKVSAKKKILWYHNGAYEYGPEEQEKHRKYFPKFDRIVAVSTDCARMLKEKIPFVSDKITVLHNLCDTADIREKAGAFVPEGFEPGGTHMVTVGRMTREKGAFLALEACGKLLNKGFDICWHWVGDGDQAQEIREAARQLGLEDRFRLEGNQANPYPYMIKGDIYVQPSFFEAYSTTVTEAKVLCRPMVVTDVGGMRDQLTDGETAWIVRIDSDAIAEALEQLLRDPALRTGFSEKLKEKSGMTGGMLDEYLQTVFQ